MKIKKELLAPAGDFETLKQAIHNGCDAVYLGGKKFGARSFAPNFNEEELKEAISYCHLYGVKIYITVNTLVYEHEMKEALDYVEFLYQNGVDALIMQDLGLISAVHERFPNLEIHASTQMHNHNSNQLKLLKELGITRVVLARELSLSEIENLAKTTDLELEVFVHGALCICYSGECLFSSLLLDRSGNRGSCAGICRLPFSLYEEETKVPTSGKYLLSPKELNELDNMEKLMASPITSFKIEGRMKSPTTIGYITKLYRQMMDSISNHEKPHLTPKQVKNLYSLFNREFTKGYLFEESDKDLMNNKNPNHHGIVLGQVLSVTKKRIKIKLEEELNQEDGIRFIPENKGMIVNFIYDQKGLLQHHASPGSVIEVDNKIGLEKSGGSVRKTIDHQLEEELKNYPLKKIPITLTVSASRNTGLLQVSLYDQENLVEKTEKIVEEATKSPTPEDRIIEQLTKMGSTPFTVTEIKKKIDPDIFIPIKELNEIRRSLCRELEEVRRNKKKQVIINQEQAVSLVNIKPISPRLHALVRTEEQLQVCLKENISIIYVTDENLYQKYNHLPNLYLRLSRLNPVFPLLAPKRLLIGETGSIITARKHSVPEVIGDYFLNVTNAKSVDYLIEQGLKRVTLSIECKDEDIEAITNSKIDTNQLEVIVYGRVEAMIMKYHPIPHLKVTPTMPSTPDAKKYYLVDRNHEKYPLIEEENCTHLFYYKPIERNIENLYEMKIRTFRLEFFDESASQTRDIIKKYQNRLIKLTQV